MIPGPDNPRLQKLVVALRKQARSFKAPVWARLSVLLLRPSRKKPAVNLDLISRNCPAGGTVAVPSKVLSLGKLSHPVTVAAVGFSANASEKIEKAGGKAISIEELLKSNPEGSKVKIII